MAKRWSSKLIGKLVGQGLANKYSSDDLENYSPQSLQANVDEVRPITKVPETDDGIATSAPGVKTAGSQYIVKPLNPIQPTTATHLPRTETEIPATRWIASQLPTALIDLSCSLPEQPPDNEAVNTDKDISGFRNWDAKTAVGYPVVAAPPLTGIGRYRRSKTATKEWVEQNTLKQLGYIAPYVKTPIEEISGDWDWEGLYSRSREESSKPEGESPVQVDPTTGANIVRGFSTVSVVKRGAKPTGPVANPPDQRVSAMSSAIWSEDTAVNLQLIPQVLSYTEDECAVESYEPSIPGILQRQNPPERPHQNVTVTGPPNPSLSAYYDPVPEEFLTHNLDAVTAFPEPELETAQAANPASSSPCSRDGPEPGEYLDLPDSPLTTRRIVDAPGDPIVQNSGEDTGNNPDGNNCSGGGYNNTTETTSSPASESDMQTVIHDNDPLHGSARDTQDRGTRADPQLEGYSPAREGFMNEQLPEFDSESRCARNEVGQEDGERDNFGSTGGYNGPHLNDYFEPNSPMTSSERREIEAFWDRAYGRRVGDNEPSQQTQQGQDVVGPVLEGQIPTAASSTEKVNDSSGISGYSESTIPGMPIQTSADLRFIDRHWNRLYEIQKEEDELRAQGVDVEAERERQPKKPLYAIFKTGTFEELEEYKVKETPQSPLEKQSPRDLVFGRAAHPLRAPKERRRPKVRGLALQGKRILRARARARQDNQTQEDNEDDNQWETVSD